MQRLRRGSIIRAERHRSPSPLGRSPRFLGKLVLVRLRPARRRRLARDEGGVARRHAIIRGVDVASRERRGARVDVDVDVDYG